MEDIAFAATNICQPAKGKKLCCHLRQVKTKGSRRISFEKFLTALAMVAETKKASLETIVTQVGKCLTSGLQNGSVAVAQLSLVNEQTATLLIAEDFIN